jgi:glycosyltransferase involved in cell wall biosynthesis
LLPYAIESVLAQAESRFELLIVCDGAPAATAECAESYARRDRRVSVFQFPKGERHGEAHRHAVLAQSSGELIAYVPDDDLWFPEHLDELGRLLADVDFGHLLHVFIDGNGNLQCFPCDLGDREIVARMMSENYNLFGPTVVGHRRSLYSRLREGWAPAPPAFPTDLHMWRKFLSTPSVRIGSRVAVTSLHFPDALRRDWTDEARMRELSEWSIRIRSPLERERIRQMILLSLCRCALALKAGGESPEPGAISAALRIYAGRKKTAKS